MIRTFPTGPALTPDLFMRQAMEQPLSPWATFSGTVADQTMQNPGLGTILRESFAPDLAKEVGGGGKGGVKWNYETAGEVAARGDKLYETEDAYKASPSYRPEIPFERGMTESRARALADMHDVSQVRQYYESKRPVIGFAGRIVGSVFDPVNFIPIAGEAASAWSVAKVGKVAGRALIGSADAAANAALFGVLTADQRGKFGDDVSWQAITANAAYAALAGAVIGGAVGAGSKFLGWDADRVAPGKVDTPRLDAPNMVEPPSAKPDGSYNLSGEATARFVPERSVSVDHVAGTLETAGNRIKAVDVLNDAVFTLANDGEVRLGERSQGVVAELRLQAAANMSDFERRRLDRGYASSDPEISTSTLMNKALAPIPEDVKLYRAPGFQSRELIYENDFLSTFGAKEPALTAASILPDGKPKIAEILVSKGTMAFSPDSGVIGNEIVLGPDTKFTKVGGVRTEVTKNGTEVDIQTYKAERNSGDNKPPNFSAPAPEQAAPNLKPAEAKIDSRATIDADPEQAAIDRAIADAKAEGFDPETGETDLDADMDILRQQEVLDATDEEALAAADETFKLVDVWQKVMAVAQACVIKS